jgi:hypothetical protein
MQQSSSSSSTSQHQSTGCKRFQSMRYTAEAAMLYRGAQTPVTQQDAAAVAMQTNTMASAQQSFLSAHTPISTCPRKVHSAGDARTHLQQSRN